MALTRQEIVAAKPREDRYWLNDTGYPLVVKVEKSGRKTFEAKFKFRAERGGKPTSVRRALGIFPDLTLAKAREEAQRLQLAAKAGETLPETSWTKPVLDETADETPDETPVPTSEAWALYMKSPDVVVLNEQYQGDKLRVLEKILEPAGIGAKPVREFTKKDFVRVRAKHLREIQDAGGSGKGVNRVQAHVSDFLTFCANHFDEATDDFLIEANFLLGLQKAVSEGDGRERELSRKELGWLFRALATVNREPRNRKAEIVRFDRFFETLLRTVTRRGDMLKLTWGMIDGEEAILPTTKGKLPHVVYLDKSVRALIGVRPNDARDGDRVFADITAEGIKQAIYRLRKGMEAEAEKEGETVEYWRPHDFRRTAMTYLVSQGIDENIADRVLAHTETTAKTAGVKRFYNKYKYRNEKRDCLILWNSFLDEIKAEAIRP